jgi:hypothetical protein
LHPARSAKLCLAHDGRSQNYVASFVRVQQKN